MGIVAATALGAGASAPAKPTAKYCEAFDDYDTILVNDFSHGYEEEFGLYEIDAQDRRAVMALVWSPRLHSAATTMAKDGPKAARSAWKRARASCRSRAASSPA